MIQRDDSTELAATGSYFRPDGDPAPVPAV